jgi:hypothetical protein
LSELEGKIFTAVQAASQSMFPARLGIASGSMQLGYNRLLLRGDGWAGYIPDLRTAAYGGYGADTSTRIEVGAGERMTFRHLTNLYGLRGMWRSEQGRP